jgi:hypothetical protein
VRRAPRETGTTQGGGYFRPRPLTRARLLGRRLTLTLTLARIVAPAVALAGTMASLATTAPARADVASPADAGNGAHVRVRGSTRLDAHASRAAGGVVISGTVTDDAGHPYSTERIVLGFTRGGDGDSRNVVSLATAVPEACPAQGGSGAVGAPPPPPALVGPDRLGIAVDAQGRFCVRVQLDPDRYTAHAEAPGSERIDGAKLDWPIDLRSPPLSIVALAFDPPRQVLSLDEPSTDVEVVASIDEDGVVRGASGLHVVLSDESHRELGDATTTPSGHALVRVPSARLGPLGPGELRASFDGTALAGPSSCAIPVVRRGRVELSIADATPAGSGVQLVPGNPEEGVSLEVTAAPRCAAAGCSGVPTGTIEARVGDSVAGAAALDHGRATLLVTFAAQGASEASLRLRYLPDAPWLAAGNEVVATLPVQGPSPWRKVALVLAGLATIAWLALGRVSLWARDSRTDAQAGKTGGKQAVARVEVLGLLPTERGWTGVVVDAHDSTPLEGARIAVERRGFERVEVVAEARAGSDGRFAIAAIDPAPGDEIVAEGSLHALLRDALPASGDLRVALVLRRRAILDRLVAWARKRGKPFDARPDPTPAHVRRAAGANSPVGRWADAVERAAFSGEVVDARVHGELEKQAPAAAEVADATDHPRAR